MYFWLFFHFVIGIALFFDLRVSNRKAHAINLKEALFTSIFWIAFALIFNLLIYYLEGSKQALDFFTCYLLEKSLSVDNLFVFLVIFNYFSVPEEYKHKVLFWGVISAILMRAFFIVIGIAIIQSFPFVLVMLGILLVFSGIKLLFHGEEPQIDIEKNMFLNLIKRFFPVKEKYVNGFFYIYENKKLFFTPLFLVLIVIETTDLIFAVDSIPAVLGLTQDPFIAYTSNIFAILGLRSLFFVLAGFAKIFYYLHYGLGAILVFIGLKMIMNPWFHVPIFYSLFIIAVLLSGSMLASLVFRSKDVTK